MMTSNRVLSTLLILFLIIAAPRAFGSGGLELPPYRTVVLENGLTVQFMEHTTVPMVSLELWFPAGAMVDPPGQNGLASLTAETLAKGSGDRSAEEFAEAVDFLGANFGVHVSSEEVQIGMSMLTRDFETGLELFADAVIRPAFPAEEVQSVRDRLAEAVASSKDNPRNVIGAYYLAYLFGEHPYGNPVSGTREGLSGLDETDVRKLHRDHYGADRGILSVVGSVDLDEAEARIRTLFGELPKAEAPRLVLTPPEAPTSNRVLLVDEPTTPQTWFIIGALGPAYGDPDYTAAQVVRTVFGGRFTSWLMTTLRTEAGLTYSARYSFRPGQVPGTAYLSTFTATETTAEAVDLALAQLDRLHEEGIDDETLASAKAYMKGQTPYGYESASQLATQITHLAFYGLDRSEIDELFSRIDAVDQQALKAVIGRFFRRQDLVFTAIGVAAEVREILEKHGDLTLRKNSDPGFR
jgi:zinc protease